MRNAYRFTSSDFFLVSIDTINKIFSWQRYAKTLEFHVSILDLILSHLRSRLQLAKNDWLEKLREICQKGSKRFIPSWIVWLQKHRGIVNLVTNKIFWKSAVWNPLEASMHHCIEYLPWELICFQTNYFANKDFQTFKRNKDW